MFNNTFVTIMAALCVVVLAAGQGKLTLFAESHHEGPNESFFVEDHDCHNLPSYFDNRATSVKTHGRCFTLYEERHCRGYHMKYEAYCGGCDANNATETRCCPHHHLGPCYLNKVVSSYQMC